MSPIGAIKGIRAQRDAGPQPLIDPEAFRGAAGVLH